MAVIVAASKPTSPKSSAAASRKFASRRVERSCCGATRTAFDEIEDILVFYIYKVEDALDFRRSLELIASGTKENRPRPDRSPEWDRRHAYRAVLRCRGHAAVPPTGRGLPGKRGSGRLCPRGYRRL